MNLVLTTAEIERFWSKVDRSGECWLWTEAATKDGSGRIKLRGRRFLAHRVSFSLAGQVLDPSLVLRHTCRNAACVRPEHLEQVSQGDNVRAGPVAGHKWSSRSSRLTTGTSPDPDVKRPG